MSVPKVLSLVLLAVVVLAGIAVLVVTNTPWGREQVREIVLSQVEDVVEGRLEIGRIDGNLLVRPRLRNVLIEDDEGRPFLEAESVALRYSLRGLLRQRIRLSDLELVNARIVLDEPPEEDWNFIRIFAPDPDPDPDPEPGWGDWVELRNIRIAGAQVTVRMPWQPDEDLPADERKEEVRRATSGELRERVVAVEGGYQLVMELHDLDARIARILAAHPDTADVSLEVAELSATALPFHPPAAEILDLSGALRIGEDTLHFHDLDLALPGSHLLADGAFEPESGEGRIVLQAEPVALEDLRFLHPPLPDGVEGRAKIEAHLTEAMTHVLAEELDVRAGEGAIGGRVEVRVDDRLRVGETRLDFEAIHTRLLEELVPGLQAPAHGRLGGSVETTPLGQTDPAATQATRLDAWIEFSDETGGRSRIAAEGIVDLGADPQDVRMRGFALRLQPLRAELVRAVVPDLALRGTIQGRAMLDGPLGGPLTVESALTHHDPSAGVSRVSTRGALAPGNGLGFRGFEIHLAPLQVPALRAFAPDLPVGGTLVGTAVLDGATEGSLTFHTELRHTDADERSWIEGEGEVTTVAEGRASVDLVLHELSLVTAGRFLPAAELEGIVTGRLRGRGTLGDLFVQTELELPDRGVLFTEGTFDLAADEPGYDFRLDLRNVNLAALSGRIDEATSLSGTAEAAGRGTDPETMQADLVSHFADEEPAVPRELHASARVAGGLVQIESLELRARAAQVTARGSFGLTSERDGRLSYEVRLDSLHAIAPFVPLSPDATAPRPGVRQAAIEHREETLLEAMREAEVEFLATGEEPTLPEPEETPGILGIRGDALAGSAEASGTVRGNAERFDLDGRLSFDELTATGHYVRAGAADYLLRMDGEGRVSATVGLTADSLLVAGFGYESVSLRADYRKRNGLHSVEAHVTASQDEDTRIVADAGVRTTAEGWELRLDDLAIRVDDALYRSRRSARVAWDEEGLTAHDLVVESDGGAIVAADGRLPHQGMGEMDLRIENLQIAHVLILIQEREGIRGFLDLNAPLRGSLAQPRFDATAEVTALTVGDERLPDVRARFGYADREMSVDASALEADQTRLTLDALLPLDLGLEDPAESRLLPDPIRVEAQLLDLPLENLPALTDQVEGVQGRVAGRLSIGGTWEDPEMEGNLELVAPSVVIVPLGVRMTDIAGSFELSDRVITVDSLVAYSRGPLRVSGHLDLSRITDPAFDLSLEARNARIMDTEDVQLRVDADLTLSGPFEALVATGEVQTRSGVIRIPETRELAAPGPLDLEDPETFERVDRVLVEARDALIDRSPLLENLEVELEVRVERDVWFRSTEANVEIFTPPEIGPLMVRMNGVRPDNVHLEGTINTERGEYEFMGRRFDIARGSLTFTGGPELDPIIRLTAEHEVQLPGREAFDIRIILDGTLTDLATELESTAQPPLSQTDLLSLVVFGREAGSLLQQHGSALSGQGGAGGPLVGSLASRATQQFATVALQMLVEEIEAETARALGLDVLHIQPTEAAAEIFTGRFGDVLRGTEVQAGRYVTSRLFVSGQARPTFVHPGARMEYRTDAGHLWRVVWRPRFLPAVPTLALEEPDRASVFGLFLFREWRF